MKLFLILIGTVFFYNPSNVIWFSNSGDNISLSKPETYILDILVLGKDTIIGSKLGGGIVISYDGGKIWWHYGRNEIRDLAKEGKRLWGIDSRIGIHEKSHARLLYSDDLGKTWDKIELDTHVFFATNFLEINGKLFIVDQLGSLWEHKKVSIEDANSWQKIVSYKSVTYAETSVDSHKAKYLVWNRELDSIYVFDLQKKTMISCKWVGPKVWSFCYFSEDSFAILDRQGNFYKYSIKNQKHKQVVKIKEYHFDGIVYLDGKFYISGMINNNGNYFALNCLISSDNTNMFIPGISARFPSVSYADKYKRVWYGTSEGIFVLYPNAKSFRQVYPNIE